MSFPDKEQLEVINDKSKTLKVIAGPGAGKTSTLVEKLLRLTDKNLEKRIDPKRVLFITFTKNSAKDIRKKLIRELESENSRIAPEDLNDLYISTFHGFCNTIREEYKEYFLNYKGAKILDEEQTFLKINDDLYKTNLETGSEEEDKEIDLELLDAWKGEPEGSWYEGINEEHLDECLRKGYELKQKETQNLINSLSIIQENYKNIFMSDTDFTEKEEELIGYYLGFYGALRTNGDELDFGLLIRVVVEALRKNEEFRKKLKSKFDYIFIDEYQDTNKIQEELLNLIVGDANVVVVGDVWQSIYGFRGSNKEIFHNFDAKTEINLSTNYRSQKNLVSVANEISNKENIMGSYSNKEGNRVLIKEFNDFEKENEEIVKFIKNLPEGVNHSDIAILTTSLKSFNGNKNPISNLIDLLKKENISLNVKGEGSLSSYDYIGEIISLLEYISGKDETKLKPKLESLSLKFIPEIYKESQDRERKSILELLYLILKDSSLFQEALKNNNKSVLKNIGTLSRMIQDFETYSTNKTIYNFLRYFRFRSKYFDGSNDSDESAINIMTLHKSKGLEFKVVIIPYVTSTRYPGNRSNNNDFKNFIPEFDPKAENLRLFYVGATRAKDLLHLSYHKKPSNYLKCIVDKKQNVNFKQHKQNTDLRSFFTTEENEVIVIEGKTESCIKEDFKVLSFGKIAEWLNCPLKYKIKFEFGLKFPTSRYVGYGIYMHNLLKNYNHSRKLNMGLNAAKFIIDEHIPKPGTRKTVEEQLNKYVKVYDSDLNNIITLEEQFKFLISNMQIIGRTDLIIKRNGKNILVDFKTGKKNENKVKLARTQLLLYSLCLPEYNICDAEVYFLKDGTKETFEIKAEDKQYMKETLFKIEKSLNLENMDYNNDPKNKNYHCMNCELAMNNICPFRKLCSKKSQEVILDENIDISLDSETTSKL